MNKKKNNCYFKSNKVYNLQSMKIISLARFTLFIIIAMSIMSCSNTNNKTIETTAFNECKDTTELTIKKNTKEDVNKTDSIVADSSIVAFLKDFYTNSVLGDKGYDKETLVNNSTKKLLQFLKDDYEGAGYDCDTGDCYAIWLFRTNRMDSHNYMEDTSSEVIKIIYLGNNWYRVVYKDMGYTAYTKIKFVTIDGKALMDEVVCEDEDVEGLYEKLRSIVAAQNDSIENEKFIGTWKGYSRMMHVTLLETYEFNKYGRGYFTVSGYNTASGRLTEDEESVYFSWRRIDSYTIETNMDGFIQIFKLANGRLYSMSDNGMPSNVYLKSER